MDSESRGVNEFENPELVPLSQLALRIQLASTAIATSLLLLFIPNIETITFFCFLFGFLFTTRYAISTTLTMVLAWEIVISMILSFSGFTFFFKIIAWILITFLGIVARKLHITKSYEFAFFGFLAALLYDFIVTISIPILFISSSQEFIPVLLTYLIFGLPFTIIHVIGNVFLFSLFPKLVSSVISLFEIKFPNFIKIKESYFENGKRYTFAFFIGFLILSSILIAAFVYTPNPGKSNEVNIFVEFNYANLRPNESFEITVFTNISFLEVTKLVANISVSYEFFGAPYVEAINNVWEYDNISDHSWIIYLNGLFLPVDVGKSLSVFDVVNGDKILWNYENTI